MAESDDLAAALPRFAAKADTLRASGLSGLEGVTRARQTGLEREHRRLSEKLGADHPRARAFAARIESGATRLVDLKMEIARARQEVRQVGAKEWMLYGFVWLRDLSPAPDLTVSLVDARGRWLEALGFACTDAHGQFQLVASIAPVEPRQEAAAPEASAPSTERHVYIRITDSDGRQLYRGEDAVSVFAGGVEYREIVLEEGTAGCASPGEDIARGPAEKREERPKTRSKRRKL